MPNHAIKDSRTLPADELQRIRTEAIAAALPHVDKYKAARKQYEAAYDAINTDPAYHDQLKSVKVEREFDQSHRKIYDLISQEGGRIEGKNQEAAISESRKNIKKIMETKPGELSVPRSTDRGFKDIDMDFARVVPRDKFEKLTDESNELYTAQRHVKQAIVPVFEKHGLDAYQKKGQTYTGDELKAIGENQKLLQSIVNGLGGSSNATPVLGPASTPQGQAPIRQHEGR